MTHESDRNEDVPWGIFGGKPGHCSRVEYNRTSTGEVRYKPAKFSGLRTETGDVITYYSPAGGGYGNPLEREPAKVLDDVLDGFIDVGHAREAYGVVLSEVDDGYGWALDSEATTALGPEMATQGRAVTGLGPTMDRWTTVGNAGSRGYEMKKAERFLKKSVSRRSVLKGGAAIAGVRRSPGSRPSGRRTSRTSRSTTPGMSYSTIIDIARQATLGPRLQGRDVGRRPSRPDQPHDPGPELDRHRRHRDLADQGLRAARRDPGVDTKKIALWDKMTPLYTQGKFAGQGGVARRRLALRVHVSRGDRRHDLP